MALPLRLLQKGIPFLVEAQGEMRGGDWRLAALLKCCWPTGGWPDGLMGSAKGQPGTIAGNSGPDHGADKNGSPRFGLPFSVNEGARHRGAVRQTSIPSRVANLPVVIFDAPGRELAASSTGVLTLETSLL